MIIKTDMTEKLFKVNYKLTPKATIVRESFVKAYNKGHAERIAAKLFTPRGRVISVHAVGSLGTRVLTYAESMER